MPVTRLDPRTALVLIDLQKGITCMPTIESGDVIVQRAAKLASAFRERD
jgi:nicotinamidase-related amidase